MTNIRLHGDERELTPMARLRDGRVVNPETLIDPIVESVRAACPSVPLDDRGGVFLTHGRIYRESGGLLELASADTQSPLEAVRQSALLRYAVADALDDVERALGLETFVVSQHNTVYNTHNSSQSTAGHFNITRYREQSHYMPLLPALLSALPILSGGGGFDLEALQFTLSVRSLRAEQLLSSTTQSRRGLIDTKAMPAAHGVRQQFLSIDNLQSHRQTRCVYTMLNLFFACSEFAADTKPDLELWMPVDDMHRMITGPEIGHPYQLVDGRRVTATEILRQFLDWFAGCCGQVWMPSWAEREIAHVVQFLDRLDREGWEALEGLADHATLYSLWNASLSAHGLDMAQSGQLRARLFETAGTKPGSPVTAEFLRASPSELVARLHAAEYPCIDWINSIQTFLRLANEYGDIRHGGLHFQLVTSGVAAEGVLFSTDHLAANTNSPVPNVEGRAAARSRAILDLHRAGIARHSTATWDGVHSPKRGLLDLRDYATCDADRWKQPRELASQKSLTEYGFSALDEYLQQRESELW